MNRVKSLIATTVLTVAFSVTAGGQAVPECKPGETLTPPCPAPLVTSDEPAAPGTQTPPDEPIVNPLSLVEVAIYTLLLA